jgi:hypothetical protein
MRHTFANSILSQLKDSGFIVHKDLKENQWGIYDGAIDNSNSLLIRSRSLGDLMKKAAREFGLK